MGNIVCFFLAIIVIYSCVFIASSDIWYQNKDIFKNVNIIQILTPIIQILLTLGIAYFINIKIFKNNKSKEFHISLLDSFLKDLSELNTLTTKYINKDKLLSDEGKKEAQEIIWNLKKYQIKIKYNSSILDENKGEKTYKSIDMTNDIRELKKLITNDPFMQKSKYNSKQKTEIFQKFSYIESKINNMRIALYK